MISTLRATILFFLLTLPFSAIAQKAQKTTSVNQIITNTNVEESLKETTSSLKAQIKSNPLGLSEAQIANMLKHFGQAFSTDKMIPVIKQTFQKKYTPALGSSVSNWMSKKNIKNVLSAQNYYYSLQGIRERIVRKYEIEQEPLSKHRKDLINSLITATSAQESTIESRAIIFRSIIEAFGNISGRNFGDSQIDGIVQNYRRQMQSQIGRELANQWAVMYYEVDDQALADYQSFLKTEAGNWLSSTTTESKQTALQSASDRFLQSLNGSN